MLKENNYSPIISDSWAVMGQNRVRIKVSGGRGLPASPIHTLNVFRSLFEPVVLLSVRVAGAPEGET